MNTATNALGHQYGTSMYESTNGKLINRMHRPYGSNACPGNKISDSAAIIALDLQYLRNLFRLTVDSQFCQAANYSIANEYRSIRNRTGMFRRTSTWD